MIEIPLKLPLYLIKYMRTLYGEPYAPKTNDEIGIYILNILQYKSIQCVRCDFLKESKKDLYSYQLSINESVYYKYGGFISISQNSMLARFIDSIFRKNLFRTAVMNHYYYSIPYKFTIINILRSYNIEENDLPYDTIRKDFNRKKEEIEKRLLLK